MAKGREPQAADTGDRAYYHGTECAQAIRKALGRDGYIAWLRGVKIAYLWRMGAKPGVDPAEDAVKDNWYGRELERVLADPTA